MNIPVDWSLLLSLVSILVTVLVAVYSHRKVQTARQAARVARQKLFNQRAAEDFEEMARTAISLASFIQASEWKRTAELATALRSSLPQALGAWSKILNPSEKDKLQVASAAVRTLIEMIPGTQGNSEPEKHQGILSQCGFVIEVVSEVAGRLKYIEEPQENL